MSGRYYSAFGNALNAAHVTGAVSLAVSLARFFCVAYSPLLLMSDIWKSPNWHD